MTWAEAERWVARGLADVVLRDPSRLVICTRTGVVITVWNGSASEAVGPA